MSFFYRMGGMVAIFNHEGHKEFHKVHKEKI